jgi:hypothetical protein
VLVALHKTPCCNPSKLFVDNAETACFNSSRRNTNGNGNVDTFALLQQAKELAAHAVLRRGLKGLRAEVTYSTLVDHYHRELVEAARAKQVAA